MQQKFLLAEQLIRYKGVINAFIQKNYKCKIAFTLAEVLITLLIIGVVASLVIPALINDTQNQEFYTLLKKDYSTLSDATKRMMMDNGGTLAGLFSNTNDMLVKFSDYVIFAKKCNAGVQGCFYTGTNSWKTLRGDYGWFSYTGSATAIFNNGGTIFFGFDRQDCEYNYQSGTPVEHTCGWVHIDVNGFKGPNVLGRDLFALWITKNGIYPFGLSNDGHGTCNVNDFSSESGRGCAAKVLTGGTVD